MTMRLAILARSVAASTLVACNATPAPRVAQQPATQAVPDVDPRIHEVEQRARITERMAELRVPAVSVAVIDHGAIVWARAYGIADASEGVPVTPDTLFQAASISKPVAAIAALRLVGEGRLALDEDVNLRLRSWKLPSMPAALGRPVTLRMLLSHTGGVTVHGFRGYAEGEPVPTLIEVLEGRRPANSAPIVVDSPPGEKHRYSGGGFVVVQALLGDVTGAPFEEVMRQTVLEPLGMAHSTFRQPLPQAQWGSAASGHRANGAPIRGHWFTHPEMAPAGLWTTPSDLARVILEMQAASTGAGRVLSLPMAAAMLVPQRGGAGLGFALAGKGERLRFSHGGSNQGFRASVQGVLRTGQGAVVMSNSDEGGRLCGEVEQAIAAVYGWLETTEPPQQPVSDVSNADEEGEDGDQLALFAE